jgi:hypothetical protein
MENPEIEALKKDIERLNGELEAVRHQIIDIWKTLVQEAGNTTEHFGSVWDYLHPVINKVFPNLRREEKRVTALLDRIANHKKSSG